MLLPSPRSCRGNDAVRNSRWLRHPSGRRPSAHSGGRPLRLEPLEERRLLATIYVDLSAIGANNGETWTDAYTDLQSALTRAISGDEIWVAEGTYKPTSGSDRTVSFGLKTGVDVYGGFAGGETDPDQRDLMSHVTTLSGDIGMEGNKGDNSYHVLCASGVTDATLHGLTITGGNASVASGNYYLGGGMFNDGSSPTLTNVTFSGNSATYGGGMFNDGSSPTLTNVTFSGNSASAWGGGMDNFDYSSPTLTNVTFRTNSAEYGGGMYNSRYSSPRLTNVTFIDNSASYNGGGMSNSSSSPTLTNVTFSGNSASYGGGGGGGMHFGDRPGRLDPGAARQEDEGRPAGRGHLYEGEDDLRMPRR